MSTVTTEEGNAILTAIINLVPDVEDAMSSIVIKKPVLDTILLGISLFKSDIISLHIKTTESHTCLGPISPILIRKESNLFERIEAALRKVELALACEM